MKIPELTQEEGDAIKATQAHRFPELRFFPKPGDDGKPIKLPVILGNPSGACKMPEGSRVSKAWQRTVAATFGKKSDAFDYGPLINDCVLWPNPVTWASWCARWPALSDSVRPALVRKYGGAQSLISEPGPEEVGAPEIAAAVASCSGSSWVRFSPKGGESDLVIKAPSSSMWALFTDAMKARDADAWKLALELAETSIAASTRPAAELLARWPGLALLINLEVSYLAGLSTEYEEGEL